MKSYKEKFYEKAHTKQEPETCEDCGFSKFMHKITNFKTCEKFKAKMAHGVNDSTPPLQGGSPGSTPGGSIKKPQNHSPQAQGDNPASRSEDTPEVIGSTDGGSFASSGFNLTEKIDAIFEMFQVLDEKITKVNIKFDRLAKELGYKVK